MFFFKVSATDPDCGVNAIVNYTMGDGFAKYREFEVNPSSGDICISAALDHEKRSIYEFPILATDRGILFYSNPSLSNISRDYNLTLLTSS